MFAGLKKSKPKADPFASMSTPDPFSGISKPASSKPIFEDAKKEEKKVVLTGDTSDVFGLKPKPPADPFSGLSPSKSDPFASV